MEIRKKKKKKETVRGGGLCFCFFFKRKGVVTQCRKEMIKNNLFFKKLKEEMRMNGYMFIRTYINSKHHDAVAKFVKHKHNRGEKCEREFWRECRGLGFRVYVGNRE